MFPDYNKEIRITNQVDQLTVPELITLLDHIGKELSKDHITEQYAQYLNYVSDQLRELRRLALEVALEAEEETTEEMYETPVFKKHLPH